MTRAPDPRRGMAWALTGSVMAAAFMVPWKAATAHGEPKLAVLVMLTAAAIFNSSLAAIDALRGKRSSPNASWRSTALLALVFALLTLVGNRLSAEGVARISGALLAVVQRCEVILVAVLGWMFLRERVRLPFWVGIAVAGFGLWILERPGATGTSFDPIGALFGLGSAICFGSMVLFARRFSERLHLVAFNALRLWLSVAMWLAVEGRLPTGAELPSGLLINAGLAGFFGPFLARLSILFSARHLAANVTALASLATPVMTLGLSFLFLDSLPAGRELAGGAVMLAGVAIPLLALYRESVLARATPVG